MGEPTNRGELQEILLATFVDEATEQLQMLNENFLALEQQLVAGESPPELLEDTFRHAHNLKGAARTVGLDAIERIAHRLETLVWRMQNGERARGREVFDVTYRALDAIRDQVDAVREARPADAPDAELLATLDEVAKDPSANGSAKPPPPPAEEAAATGEALQRAAVGATIDDRDRLPAPTPGGGEPPPRLADDTVRIATSKLDALVTQVGELIAARRGEDRRYAELRELSDEIDDRDIRRRLDEIRRQLEGDGRRMARVTADLQERVRRARMLPVGTVFEGLPRLARDLARELGKEVVLTVQGGQTEVDRSVLQQLSAPLGHLVRNAVDHGIEDPDSRIAVAKSREGAITVAGSQRGGSLIVSVSDDGGGIDVDRLRASGVRKGLMTDEAARSLSDVEATRLIFRSGFSTRAEVTGVSGRGVGMDVVRESVERMHGMVDVRTRPGMGATFTLSLPLSIATVRCLIVRSGGQAFGIPINNVDRIARLTPEPLTRAGGRDVIEVDGRPVQAAGLAEALELPPPRRTAAAAPAVVLGTGDNRTALIVDRLAGVEEIAVKQLPAPFRRVRNVAGTTILGSGEIVIVLSAPDLLGSARASAVTASYVDRNAPRAGDAPTVLVVDDSITTRTLEKNLLEAAGYRVQAAADGAEAWELMQGADFACVVCDVQMPRVDGIELAQRIRSDERLKDVPFVLVTSLAAGDDRRRGIEAGADAYIVKGSFDQDQLLGTVKRLI